VSALYLILIGLHYGKTPRENDKNRKKYILKNELKKKKKNTNVKWDERERYQKIIVQFN